MVITLWIFLRPSYWVTCTGLKFNLTGTCLTYKPCSCRKPPQGFVAMAFTGMQWYSGSKIHVCFSLIRKTSLTNLGHTTLTPKKHKRKKRYIFFHSNARRFILDDPPGNSNLIITHAFRSWESKPCGKNYTYLPILWYLIFREITSYLSSVMTEYSQ